MLSRIALASLFTFVMAGTSLAQDFRPVSQWPDIAPGSYGISGANLPDGRLIVWNGLDVFIQDEPGGGYLNEVATGYQGDPGFLAIAPDGYTALLGPGYSPKVYLLDTRAPVDFLAGSEIAAPTHFSGAFLNQDLVVFDRGLDDFSASELVVLDLSAKKQSAAPRSVLTFSALPPEKSTVLDKPLNSFSSRVHVDLASSTLYVMDANVRELRSFALADVIAAFNNATVLDWSADGTLIGAAGSHFSGGVAGVTPEGNLIVAGSEGYLQPGGIQIVDPTDGSVLEVLDPAGSQEFYSAIYNSALNEIIAVTPDRAFATEDAIASLPTGRGTTWFAGAVILLSGAIVIRRTGNRTGTTA
jgi:hypothetical protein